MEYRKTSIQTSCAHTKKGERVTVRRLGYVAVNIGLGYWVGEDEDGDATYTLTHIPSGAAMATFYDEENVTGCIEDLARLRYWDVPVDELEKHPHLTVKNEIKATIKKWQFEDAANSAMGGTA